MNDDPNRFRYNMRRYASGRSLAVATLVLLGCNITLRLFTEMLSVSVGEKPDLTMAALLGLVAVLQIMAMIATVVLFLVWLARAHHNMTAMGSRRITMSPGWAVGGWFIPIYNLAHGFSSVNQLWMDSEPSSADVYTVPKTPALVGWWWGMYLLSGVISWVVVLRGDFQHPSASWAAISSASSLTAGVLFGMVVWRIQRRQDAQFGEYDGLAFLGLAA